MDYKNTHDRVHIKTISDIERNIINELKASKLKNKNGINLLNKINQNLFQQSEERKIELKNNYPDLYNSYVDSFNEYESDYLENFIKFDLPVFLSKYSNSQLETFFTKLGAYRAYSKGSNNFSNSRVFLEYAYDLNKYYDKYTLNFDDQNSNPINSPLFEKMKKEKYPNSKPELRIYLESKEVKSKETNQQEVFTEKEKYYLSFILFELLQVNSPMNKVEFMKLIVLTQNIFDKSILKTKSPASLTSYKSLKELDDNLSKKIEFLSELKVKAGNYNLKEVQAVIGSKISKLRNNK